VFWLWSSLHLLGLASELMATVMAGTTTLVAHKSSFAFPNQQLGSSSKPSRACIQKEFLGSPCRGGVSRSLSSVQKKMLHQLDSAPGKKVSAMAAVGADLKEYFVSLEQKTDTSKETVLEFYVHEVRIGPGTTVMLNAGTGHHELKLPGYGSMFVFDNDVREGGSRDSKLVGRERGHGSITDEKFKEGLQLMSKITFNEDSQFGPGSLSFSGNVGGAVAPYELIVLGGTGNFRGAKGYAIVENCPPHPPAYSFHWRVHLSH
jgi:hypothetical protein